jgi:hypothetical protein
MSMRVFFLLQQVHCQRKIRGAPALCEWTGVGTCLYIPILGYPSFIQDFGYIRNDAVIQGFTFTSFGTTLGSRSGFVHRFASSWPIFDMVLVCFGHICSYWHGSSIVFRVAPTWSMITEGVRGDVGRPARPTSKWAWKEQDIRSAPGESLPLIYGNLGAYYWVYQTMKM